MSNINVTVAHESDAADFAFVLCESRKQSYRKHIEKASDISVN